MTRLLLIPALLTFTLVHAQDIHTGDGLLRAMHDRYQSSWYQTVTFTQKSTTYKADAPALRKPGTRLLSCPESCASTLERPPAATAMCCPTVR